MWFSAHVQVSLSHFCLPPKKLAVKSYHVPLLKKSSLCKRLSIKLHAHHSNVHVRQPKLAKGFSAQIGRTSEPHSSLIMLHLNAVKRNCLTASTVFAYVTLSKHHFPLWLHNVFPIARCHREKAKSSLLCAAAAHPPKRIEPEPAYVLKHTVILGFLHLHYQGRETTWASLSRER